jgi:serine/threonine protein kinase
LGKGSYGKVYKVKTTRGQELAIKEFTVNPQRYFRQIVREVDSLKFLHHPNIARFYDCYIVDDSKYYVVIEYCSKGTLPTYLSNNNLSDYEKLLLCKNIADGLAYAHQKKIVHRDLKPENILIARNGIAKICDFGCSCSTENGEGAEVVLRSHIGTPAYMDKRISTGEPYDMSVDIYAMALVFFSIFKGKGIYDDCSNHTEMEVKRSRIYGSYDEMMDDLLNGIPSILKKIIKNCLQADHPRRYKATEVAALFEK